MLALVQWGPIVNIRPKHPLFPRKTQPPSRNGKQQGRWEGTSNKLKGPVCIQHTDTSRNPCGKDAGHHTPKANVLEGIIIVLTCQKKGQGGGLELNRLCRGSDIFISLSRLTFPLKQPDWLVCLCYYGGGKENSTLFFHGRSVLVTARISLSLSSALALTPECCVTSIGADDVFCDTFLPMWVLRLVLRSHVFESYSLYLQPHLFTCFYSHFSSF